jgi:hypothetical protein
VLLLTIALPAISLVGLPGRAEDARWPIEAVYTAEQPILIPIGPSPEKAEVKLPAIGRQAGKRLCLMFKARLHLDVPGGWNANLGITINGQSLGETTAAGASRLINRTEACQTTLGDQPWWSRTAEGPRLLTFFGPAEQLDKRVLAPLEEPYLYVLDISDVANYVETGADERIESAKPNAIVLVNHFCRKPSDPETRVRDMAIEGLAVGYLPESLVVEHQKANTVQFAGDKEKARLAGDGFALVVTTTGGIRLEVGKDTYFVASSFSYPGETIGFNRLTPDDARGEKGWTPEIRKTDEGTITIEAAGAHWRLARTLRLLGPRCSVEDRLVNTTDAPVGILVDNQLSIPGFPAPESFYLSGVEGADSLGVGHAENPTLLVTQASSSLGLLAEDNVYRLQLAISRKANAFSFATRHFGLDAKAEYTLRWTLYPRAHRDYWAFINEVRRDWDVNFTIQGPFQFELPADGRNHAKLCAVGPWFEYNSGAGLSNEKYLETYHKLVAEQRQAHPDVVLMPLLENNLVSIDTRSLPGGETLPTSPAGGTRGTYGLELSKEQSAVLASSPYADSVIRTEDGRIVVDTYYASAPYLNLMLYPRRGNYRQQRLLEQIDFMMDKVGYRGIYIDQFSLAWGVLERMDRRTMERWDGHTVDIDVKTGRIARKYTDCALVGADARADLLKHILDKGGQVVCNSHACVSETQKLPAFRFAEMENDPVDSALSQEGKPPCFAHEAKGHLSSPIILGIRPERLGQQGKDEYARIVTKAMITGLRNGCLYYYYGSAIPAEGPGAGDYGPGNHMFPFTPVELHAGWLLGKERLLTCVSGAYTVPGAKPPRCYLFDRTGREKANDFAVEAVAGGHRVAVKLNDWNEIAVLEAETPVP